VLLPESDLIEQGVRKKGRTRMLFAPMHVLDADARGSDQGHYGWFNPRNWSACSAAYSAVGAISSGILPAIGVEAV